MYLTNATLANPHLAFRFVGRSLCASDFVLHGKIMEEGVSLLWGEVGLPLLAKVELDGTVFHQHMGEERPSCQRLLGGPESNAQVHSVL